METALISTEARIETLRKCEFLQGLKDSVLSDLAAKAEILSVDCGKKIVTRGESGSTMYFIISGSARVHHGDVVLANIGTGDVFGEMAVLDSERRSASVTAESKTLLLSIERDVFYESLSTDPNAFKAVIHGVLQREREIIHEVKTRSTKLMAYEKEMEIGRRIQSGFLPGSIPVLENWELASSFVAAREVAGDFYDVFKLNNLHHLAIVIGDVCDKGVGAALFMTLFRSLIRASSLYGNMCSGLVDAESEALPSLRARCCRTACSQPIAILQPRTPAQACSPLCFLDCWILNQGSCITLTPDTNLPLYSGKTERPSCWTSPVAS